MKFKYFLLIFSSAIIAGCTKSNLSVDNPSVNISLAGMNMIADTFVYHIGDTVSFNISGKAGNLAFYPGTPGYDYDDRNTTQLDDARPVLSFSSTLQWGNQQNTLKILATDKLAALDSASVVSADWTDITPRALLATSATATPAGNIDLSDIISGPRDSLFIAFRYQGTTGTTQRTWTITNYTVDNVVPEGTFNITNLSSDASYWTKYGNVHNPANALWVATSSQLQVVGGGATSPTDTAWIVSRPLYVGSVSSSVSIAVKSVTDADISGYDYIYNTAGTYKAVWVAFNNTSRDQKTVVKEFIIKITAP